MSQDKQKYRERLQSASHEFYGSIHAGSDELKTVCRQYNVKPGDLLNYHESHGMTDERILRGAEEDMGIPPGTLDFCFVD